ARQHEIAHEDVGTIVIGADVLRGAAVVDPAIENLHSPVQLRHDVVAEERAELHVIDVPEGKPQATSEEEPVFHGGRRTRGLVGAGLSEGGRTYQDQDGTQETGEEPFHVQSFLGGGKLSNIFLTPLKTFLPPFSESVSNPSPSMATPRQMSWSLRRSMRSTFRLPLLDPRTVVAADQPVQVLGSPANDGASTRSSVDQSAYVTTSRSASPSAFLPPLPSRSLSPAPSL